MIEIENKPTVKPIKYNQYIINVMRYKNKNINRI